MGNDWNEIIMLVIGALIGIGSSVAMMFIQNVNEKLGNMSIYTKFICLKKVGEYMITKRVVCLFSYSQSLK